MEMIAEILYWAYENGKHNSDNLRVKLSEEYHELTRKFISSLSEEQSHDYYEIDFMELGFEIEEEKNVIKFMLQLMHPEH